jgi:hypothetical protein
LVLLEDVLEALHVVRREEGGRKEDGGRRKEGEGREEEGGWSWFFLRMPWKPFMWPSRTPLDSMMYRRGRAGARRRREEVRGEREGEEERGSSYLGKARSMQERMKFTSSGTSVQKCPRECNRRVINVKFCLKRCYPCDCIC